jgi:hypothetical protein
MHTWELLQTSSSPTTVNSSSSVATVGAGTFGAGTFGAGTFKASTVGAGTVGAGTVTTGTVGAGTVATGTVGAGTEVALVPSTLATRRFSSMKCSNATGSIEPSKTAVLIFF